MPSSRGDEGVQLLVGDVADQVRPQAPAPRPHRGVDQHGHGGSLPGRPRLQRSAAASVSVVTEEIRWGVVGPGRIAEKVVEDFAVVDGARAVAVASRSLDRAQAFAARHGIERAYGSYAEILADPDVDVLYLATPHPQHHAIALAALRAGKALLVEKAFTATTAGAAEVVDLARETGVFVMEAMWTRFQPAVVALRELVADGAIGEVRSVQADLGVAREYDPADRLFDLALGGGALLDLGVYVVSFAQMLLGHAGARRRRRVAVPLRRRRRGGAAARLRRRPDGDAHDLAAQRAARPGPGLRDDGLDRRPPPLPPPGDDRAAPRRRRARDDHPAARSARATRTS